jgi:hypothetical protein
MVSKTIKKYMSLGLLVIATGGLVACGKKTSGNSSSSIPVNPGDGGDDTDELTRRCRIPVRFTNTDAHEAALESLVQARVSRKERPTTMCVAAPTTPTKRFPASLRFEYEDNYGLRWVTFRKADLVYSEQSSSKFRLLYLDRYGYVDLKTTKNSAGKYSGSVRVAEIDQQDSYLEDIEEFLKKVRQTCREYPAKCLNPIFVTDPNAYNPPTEAQLLQRAEEAFQGKHRAKTHTLGTVTFDPNDIELTLF